MSDLSWELLNEFLIMSGPHKSETFFMIEMVEDLKESVGVFLVKRARRLISEKSGRSREKSTDHGDLLLKAPVTIFDLLVEVIMHLQHPRKVFEFAVEVVFRVKDGGIVGHPKIIFAGFLLHKPKILENGGNKMF